MVEVAFKETETKYGNQRGAGVLGPERGHCLFMVVSHNIRTYIWALALNELEFFLGLGLLDGPSGVVYNVVKLPGEAVLPQVNKN